DDLQVRVLALRIRVLGPESLDGSVRRDGELAGLPEALRGVVVACADLDRLAPGPALVVRVRDVELDVAVAGAREAEDGPEDVDAPEPRAPRRVVDGDPLVVVERRLVVRRSRLDGIRPRGAVVVGARDRRLLGPRPGPRTDRR